MSVYRIASRYAKSLLELSIERGSLEEVMKDMQNFNEICTDNREFALMLKNPIVAPGKKLSVLKSAFEGKVNEITYGIISLVTKKSREQFLPEIAAAFMQQYHNYKGIVESSITTVTPLSAEMKKEVTAIVEKLTSKKVDLTEKIDESLIGGFVLKIGDKQIDDSVSSKLRELRLRFVDSHNYVSKV